MTVVADDTVWLNETGWPLVSGIADFWASRATPIPGTSQFGINGVQPPDEYHYPVNNSVYTNVVAGMAIEFAISAAGILGRPAPPLWTAVAGNLVVLFNATAQMHPEYDGYTDEIVKQADVILLGFPLMYAMPASVRANDLLFYANHTDLGGPAMTWAMFAVGWLDCGDWDAAAAYFAQGHANIQAPFNVWQETPTGGTVNFITGAGGFLQSVVFGYGGVRLLPGQLAWSPPPLPQNATALKLASVHYRGSTLDLAVAGGVMTVTLVGQQSGAAALQFVPGTAGPVTLQLSEPVSVPVQSSYIHALPA